MAAPRNYQRHEVRREVSLDGWWQVDFPVTGTRIQPGSGEPVRRVAMEFPDVWESYPETVNYFGEALASRTFELECAGALRLHFRGVSHTARVFLDGVEVGGHHNAFTPFAIDLSWVEAGRHEILLHITNSIDGEFSALHLPNDYYCYGGITRPATVEVLSGKVYLRYAHFRSSQSGNGWTGHLRYQLVNLGESEEVVSIESELAGKKWSLGDLRVAPGAHWFEAEEVFDGVTPWTPEVPQLYRLVNRVVCGGEVIDDLVERVGFRVVELRGDRILLNGEPVFLKGLNRHEDHAIGGCAIPAALQRRDAEILLDLGANSVRTSHYPNDQRFLDYCDEMGILVWEENHARGLREEKMRHPLFREQCAACNEEMVLEHYNHASIITWGILNECASQTEYGRSCYAEQFEQIKKLDPHRPTVYASCCHNNDICQDLPDICAWNWYYGWYVHHTPIDEGVGKAIEYIDSHGGAGKPLIASEFGGGAIPGYHDPIRQALWSEERQATVLDENLSYYLNEPRFCGAFIWQFCDVRVTEEDWSMKRPRTMNNKGVVDQFRNRKLGYLTVQKHFGGPRSWAGPRVD